MTLLLYDITPQPNVSNASSGETCITGNVSNFPSNFVCEYVASVLTTES